METGPVSLNSEHSVDSSGHDGASADLTSLLGGSPLLTGVACVLLQRAARELAAAVATLGRQLAHRLLHGQVPGDERARDLDAAVGAGGRLVPQPGVGQ